jgi:hypothetical protein
LVENLEKRERGRKRISSILQKEAPKKMWEAFHG